MPTSVQRPPSRVAKESGITTARGARPARRLAENTTGSISPKAPTLFITVETPAPTAQITATHPPRRARDRAAGADQVQQPAALQRLHDQQDLDHRDHRGAGEAREGLRRTAPARGARRGEPGERHHLDAEAVERRRPPAARAAGERSPA